ncbi:hypothetical protein ACWDE9_22645, partial [Streptomyces olivaceoviridis]
GGLRHPEPLHALGERAGVPGAQGGGAEEAAAGYDKGELLMMPPTVATLRQLLPYGSAAEALAAAPARDMTPVLARARLQDGEIVLSWPGHDEFTKHVPTAPTPAETTAETTGGGPA